MYSSNIHQQQTRCQTLETLHKQIEETSTAVDYREHTIKMNEN